MSDDIISARKRQPARPHTEVGFNSLLARSSSPFSCSRVSCNNIYRLFYQNNPLVKVSSRLLAPQRGSDMSPFDRAARLPPPCFDVV